MEFSKYISTLEDELGQRAALEVSKDIQYGHLFRCRRDEEKVTLTIYNGKKGLRLVWQGEGELRRELETFIESIQGLPKAKASAKRDTVLKPQQSNSSTEAEANFPNGVWAGSDESGKGDFFGPLVLGAVALNTERAVALQEAGVKDCKLLTDKKILELESVIKDNALAYCVLQLQPRFYNQRYGEVVEQGGNLNTLLASGHINALTKILRQLEEKQLPCEYALIDQFTASDIVLAPLRKSFPGVVFRQQPKAEQDLAVASASILARAQFLHSMTELAQQAGVAELPKGGGQAATDMAHELAEKAGKEALNAFVKRHFANYKRI